MRLPYYSPLPPGKKNKHPPHTHTTTTTTTRVTVSWCFEPSQPQRTTSGLTRRRGWTTKKSSTPKDKLYGYRLTPKQIPPFYFDARQKTTDTDLHTDIHTHQHHQQHPSYGVAWRRARTCLHCWCGPAWGGPGCWGSGRGSCPSCSRRCGHCPGDRWSDLGTTAPSLTAELCGGSAHHLQHRHQRQCRTLTTAQPQQQQQCRTVTTAQPPTATTM